MRLLDQRVVGPLAGPACCVALVSESANPVRSLVNPALQVGEQIGGGSGCLAACGSGGIKAGRTGKGGGNVGALRVAQPLASSASSISVSARPIELSSRVMDHLRLRRHTALGFDRGRGPFVDGLGLLAHALGIPGTLHTRRATGVTHGPLVLDEPCGAGQQHRAHADPQAGA